MEIITWNVQACTGVDGREDLPRICDVIRRMGDADVICLQEVARHMLSPDGAGGDDQVAALGKAFPEHEAIFGPGIDLPGKDGERQQFGNVILSRLPVAQCFRHPLPQPPEPGVLHMPRQATEVVVETGTAPLRITTTHLEFHSVGQRRSQIRRMLEIHADICAGARNPPLFTEHGPYARVPRPVSAILCGDFNFPASDDLYRLVTAEPGGDAARFVDAWRTVHGDRPHAPTCGIFDHRQWPEGAHCRDFFFVTEDLATAIEHVEVETETDASDHQPVKLSLRR